MKQYCRYCAHCDEGDVFYCTENMKVLSEASLKRANNCPSYGYCGIDIITGKEHVERRVNVKTDNGSEQLRIEVTE